MVKIIKRFNVIKNKRGFELSFGMLFSIIAGAFIIFLAIYATTRFVGTSQQTSYSEAAVAIANIMNPIVNGITSAQATKVDFKKETRIYLNCSVFTGKSPYFGSETISFSEESGLLKKWSAPGYEIPRYNKYIFSEGVSQGKTLNIFAKPFYTGFKVDDLIMISTKNYCFVSAPTVMQEEISMLNLKNVNMTNQASLCPKDSVKVCFGFEGCNISVQGECNDAYCKSQFDTGIVIKNNNRLYYTGSLIYAAIFSSPEIYTCNLERLGKKTAELSKVYIDKINIIKESGCSTIIEPYLSNIALISENLTMSKLANLNYQAKLMDEDNCKNLMCRIYMAEGC